MKELTMEERKTMSLNILRYLADLCNENGITYYLAYGSLLGSVRHGGFIPWDDDIDVWVPFNDFLKLMDVLHKEDKYEILDYIEGSEWKSYFSKLSDKNTVVIDKHLNKNNHVIRRGLAIDIFPLYNFDTKNRNTKKLSRCISRLKMISNYYNKQYDSFLKRTISCVMAHSFWKYRTIISRIKKMNKLINPEFFSTFGSIYGQKDIHSVEAFGSPKEGVFEGEYFSIPNNSDLVLSNIYGNYSELPPIEKRVSNHNVMVYRKDEND